MTRSQPAKSDYAEMLARLAAGRRRRMKSGRPVFNLSADEVRRSAETAMRLAKGRRQW